jgi:hypothetical protein
MLRWHVLRQGCKPSWNRESAPPVAGGALVLVKDFYQRTRHFDPDLMPYESKGNAIVVTVKLDVIVNVYFGYLL